MIMKKATQALGLSVLALLCVAITHLPTIHAASISAGKSSTCCWHIVSTPNLGSDSNEFYAMTAISSHDAWAVGAANAADGHSSTLTEHWNGKTWSIIASSSPNPNFGFLQGVSSVSSSDVWAVGSYNSLTTGATQTLIEHWSGKTWHIVPSPEPTDVHPNGSLSSVAALSTNNVWAAGFYSDTKANALKTLIEHWNGHQWSVIPTPNPTSYCTFNSITAVSANDIWAVGSYDLPNNGGSAALVEHWNGKTWSIVSTPRAGSSRDVSLTSVYALSTKNVWAVGSYYTSNYNSNTLIEHWNGTQWSIVSSPAASKSVTLSGVVALSKDNVWAVGNTFDSANPNSVSTTLIEHWNGNDWNIVASPNPSGTYATLNSIARVPGTSRLLVGGYYSLPDNSNSGYVVEKTLIEQYD